MMEIVRSCVSIEYKDSITVLQYPDSRLEETGQRAVNNMVKTIQKEKNDARWRLWDDVRVIAKDRDHLRKLPISYLFRDLASAVGTSTPKKGC